MDAETQLRAWGAPPTRAEQEALERADGETREAIRASQKLKSHNVAVFVQGSYRNRTNIPRESDVDICVCCNDTFFYDPAPLDENVRRAAAFGPAAYEYGEFKNDVEAALVARFGRAAVRRGDKAFIVRETTYRVDADVVAAFEHRRYTGVGTDGRARYVSGTELRSESGNRIINWPQQNYDNGVVKNRQTGERFKAMVRVLKNLRTAMEDAHIPAANPIPSYLVECLVWNVPNLVFGHAMYFDELREVIRSVYLSTQTHESCAEWAEVNELKYLFRGGQSWSREQANAFLLAAWQYVGYGNT